MSEQRVREWKKEREKKLRNLIHISFCSINNFYFKFIRCLCENSKNGKANERKLRIFLFFLFLSSTQYTYFMSCIYLALSGKLYLFSCSNFLSRFNFYFGAFFFVDKIIKLWLNFPCTVAIITPLKTCEGIWRVSINTGKSFLKLWLWLKTN